MEEKYVVIIELDNGYMECAAVCDTPEEAYGAAFIAVTEGLKSNDYCVTLPEPREGENGYVISSINKKTGKEEISATVLFYKKEEPFSL